MSNSADLLRALEATRDETLPYFALGEADLSRSYGPGKWSVRFLLHHLADSETVLYDRIRRVLCEPRQTLLAFDQDGWAQGLDYAGAPLNISRAVYESVRNAIIYLADRYHDTHGHLTFVHSTMGERTLRMEFDKVAAHNAHHLAHIHAALARGNQARRSQPA